MIDSPIWSQLAFPIAVYSVARFGTAAGAWVALGVSVLAAAVATVDWSSWLRLTRRAPAAALLPQHRAIVITSWALGTVGRTREAHVAALVDRAERRAEAEREVQLAAHDERSRIAREMHDVVAHGLSVIVVQADGARYAAAKDPEVAVRTLETIGAHRPRGAHRDAPAARAAALRATPASARSRGWATCRDLARRGRGRPGRTSRRSCPTPEQAAPVPDGRRD